MEIQRQRTSLCRVEMGLSLFGLVLSHTIGNPTQAFLPRRVKGSVECTHSAIDFELTSLPRSLPLGGCVNPYFFPLLSGHVPKHRLYTPRPLASPFVAPVRTALQACLPQDASDFGFGWPSVSLSCEPPFHVADFTPSRHRRLPAAGYLKTYGNVLKQQQKRPFPKAKHKSH